MPDAVSIVTGNQTARAMSAAAETMREEDVTAARDRCPEFQLRAKITGAVRLTPHIEQLVHTVGGLEVLVRQHDAHAAVHGAFADAIHES